MFFAYAAGENRDSETKVFWFFFSKKNFYPALRFGLACRTIFLAARKGKYARIERTIALFDDLLGEGDHGQASAPRSFLVLTAGPRRRLVYLSPSSDISQGIMGVTHASMLPPGAASGSISSPPALDSARLPPIGSDAIGLSPPRPAPRRTVP